MTIRLAKTGFLVLGLLSAILITLLSVGMPGNTQSSLPPISREGTESPRVRAMRAMQAPSSIRWQGLIEPFTVTTLESPLPQLPPGTIMPGRRIPDLGQRHVEVATPVTYNSNPPTSGPHYPYPAGWGIYNRPPVNEFLVHNLEHGGVIISYDPDRIQGQELERLRAQARSLSNFNPRILVTPWLNLDKPIVLTAWTYLQKLDRYDPTAVEVFYNTHIARGPECEDGLCPP